MAAEESKYKIASVPGVQMNWDYILGSTLMKGFAGMIANANPNSYQEATKRFNEQQFSPLNYLPNTVNISQQSMYGMNDGGLYESEDMMEYLMDQEFENPFASNIPSGEKSHTQKSAEDAEKGIMSTVEPTRIRIDEDYSSPYKMLSPKDILGEDNQTGTSGDFNFDLGKGYSSIRTKSDAVNINSLDKTMMNLTSYLSNKFPGLVVTSGKDGKHMSGSRHYDGLAVDIGANSSDKNAYAKMKAFFNTEEGKRAKELFGLEDVIDEGDHFHFELPKRDQGGTAGKRKVSKEEAMNLQSQGYNPIGNNTFVKNAAQLQALQQAKASREVGGIAYENWIKDQLKNGRSIKELVEAGYGTFNGLESLAVGVNPITDTVYYEENKPSGEWNQMKNARFKSSGESVTLKGDTLFTPKDMSPEDVVTAIMQFKPKVQMVKNVMAAGTTNKYKEGGSIVDYLVSQGQDHRFSARKKIAEQMGIENYTGTAEQNLRMLANLQGQQRGATLETPEGLGGQKKTNVINPRGRGVVLDVPSSLVPTPDPPAPKDPGRFIKPDNFRATSDSPESSLMSRMKEDSEILDMKSFAKRNKQTPKIGEASLFDLGTKYIKRQIQKFTGDDETQVSKIKEPVPTVNTEKAKPQELLPPPIITGDTLWDSKERGIYHLPEVIDLKRVKLGARNRGENTPVQSDGFLFGAFGGPGSDENMGYKKVAPLSAVADDKIYMGIDDKGSFHLDYGKNIKGKNIRGYEASFDPVQSFVWEGNKVKQQRDRGNAGSNVPVYRRPDGSEGTLNLLMPRGNKNREDVFSEISGGRFIISTPDLKQQYMLSGSVRTVSEQLEKFKQKFGVDHVLLTHVDNGSYSRGYRDKDGHMSEYNWSEYDAHNNTGGAGFYLQGKGYEEGGIVDLDPQEINRLIEEGYEIEMFDEEKRVDMNNFAKRKKKK